MQVKITSQGIYRQIAEFGIEQVLSGTWKDGERIPSVRQLAAEVGVNPNTVMSAYDHLKSLNIIETQRGRGFFVTETGQQSAIELRRTQFIEEEIPKLQHNLELLNISMEELITMLTPEPNNN